MKLTPTPALPTPDEIARWAGEGGNPGRPAPPTPLAGVIVLAKDLEQVTGDSFAFLSENIQVAIVRGLVGRAEILEVLDYLAAHVPGYPFATRRAAELAAAIRVRGLA
jgi:hypothetical protein